MAKLIEKIEKNLVEIKQNTIKNKPSKEEQIKEIEAMIFSMKESALPYKVNITMQHGKVQKVDEKRENKKMEIGLFEDMIKN